MSKPSTLPSWATSGGAAIVVPSSAKQAAGWGPSEKPPAQYLNWHMNLVGQWAAYLDAGIFAGNIEVTGNLKVDGKIAESAKVIAFGLDGNSLIATSGGVVVSHTAGTAGVVVDGTVAGEAYFRIADLHAYQRLQNVVVAGTSTGGNATLRLYTYAPGSSSYTTVAGTAVTSGATVSLLVSGSTFHSGLGASMTPTTPVVAGGSVYVLGINCGSGVVFTATAAQLSADIP